jgi:hypothetical protein
MSLICDWTVEIGVDQVLVGQGIDPGSASPRVPGLRAAAARAIDVGLPILEPRVASRRLPAGQIEHVADAEAVARRLPGADELVIVVCTVGEAISRQAGALMERDPVAALAMEGLACAGVDALATAFCRDEGHRAAGLGWRTTAPISPGMDGWPLLAGQRVIFGLVDAAGIGVRLSESGQMQPCKSLSFIVGIGAGVREDERSSCERCGARPACRWIVGRERPSGGL